MEWRKWANQHIYARQGVSFEEMTGAQREAAFAMLAASLSAKGLQLTRDIMHLNETLGELNGHNFVEFGEGKYWVSVMGEPSATEPWGWQLDGHHLNLNYFVLGDQVVMTPAFWGSEPAVAESGSTRERRFSRTSRAAGSPWFARSRRSSAKMRSLKPPRRENNILAQAFSDNIVLDYAGVRASSFSDAQKRQFLDLDWGSTSET